MVETGRWWLQLLRCLQASAAMLLGPSRTYPSHASASQHRVAFLLERGLLTPGPYTLAHVVADRQGAALSLRSMPAAQPASLEVMAVH